MRRAPLLAALALALVALPGGSAQAATPTKTDILLLFDTTGSMGSALSSAKDKVGGLKAGIDAKLPNVQYGVAQVRDYPYYSSGDEAYEVVQPVTANGDQVRAGIDSLNASGGGDGPEAYGGALDAADAGTGGLGWRPGARRLVILVADNMPHDDDLNRDIPAELQIQGSPFDTGIDPGPDGVLGTSDDLDWQPLLGRLADHGIPLMYVLFEGRDDYLPYWKVWAGATGGGAAQASDSNLEEVVVALAEAGATGELPPCPAGQSRGPDGRCGVVQAGPGVSTFSSSGPSITKRPFYRTAWTTVRDGYNSAKPCDGEPADVGNNWRVFKKTIACIGSGKVFFDSELKGQARCIVGIGASIIPVGRLLGAGKAARAFADEARKLVPELRALKLSGADRELVDQIDNASKVYGLIAAGSWSARAESAVQALLTSREATLRLERILRTNGKLTAVRHLRSTQEAARRLFTAISGIEDAAACAKAF